MITSRSLDDLLEPVKLRAEMLLRVCEREGINLLVTSTYRDFEAQRRLYAHGRSIPGQIVTWADAGDSWHNWRRAFDIVPLRNGKPIWSTRGHDWPIWERVGEIGVNCGLEWGGNWQRHPDYVHFQDKCGANIQKLKRDAGLIKRAR